jgi:hypothetical protein
MKKGFILFFTFCLVATAAQAAIIDDFDDTSLTEYTLTLVLDQNPDQDISFQSPSGAIQVTKTAGEEAEQVVFLRDDYSLDIGRSLVADLDWGSTTRADIGIMVAATATPTALVYDTTTGGTQETREDYIAVYAQADNTNLKGIFVDGTTAGDTIYAGGLPDDPKTNVVGLYIRREDANEFTLGFITSDSEYVDFTTGTITNTNIGNAVGIFGDMRSVTTYGDLDNLRITFGDLGEAWDPDPQDDATNVGTANGNYVQLTLSWKTGLDPANPNNFDPNINNHLLYLDVNDANLGYGNGAWSGGLGGAGGEINIPETGPDFNASQTFTNLDYSTTYYWRVDESVNNSGPNTVDDANTREGNVWSFTTIGKDPEITDQPDDALADVNDEVLFSATISSATAGTYYWWKSADAVVGDDSLVKSAPFPVGTSDVNLTVIANDSNDAWYYVVVDNTGSAVDPESDIVHLWLKREIARYKLNNDLTDSSAAGKGGTAEWDAVGVFDSNYAFVAGLEGSHALELYGDFNTFVSVPDSNDYFNHYVRGLTVSCWLKVDPDIANWDPVVSKHSRSTMDPDQGWVIEIYQGGPVFQIRNAGVYASGPSIADSNWHMVTARFNYDEWNAGMYVDGELEGYDGSVNRDGAVKCLDRLAIGTVDANDGSYAGGKFKGQIDDVRIWTYPLSGVEIAALYIDTYGDYHGKGSICVNGNYPTYDFDGDCNTDLADFAIFAETWLDCNLYPQSACN